MEIWENVKGKFEKNVGKKLVKMMGWCDKILREFLIKYCREIW